ncbi:hypothetical protein DJ564_05885 [Pseudomonas sp. 31-12]|nr:hypothetical protein DJ564_05885 [Pseudomonas sp. 31-12]
MGAGLLAKAGHSTLISTDPPPSRASPLPQLNWVHLQEIGRLSGRLRGQASLLQERGIHPPLTTQQAER